MCVLKRLAATRSITLDRYERFEIGLYELAMSGSKFDFLSSGITRACFKEIGNTPDFIDKLHDMTSAIVPERRLSNQVGIGSRQHDLHGELFISPPLRAQNCSKVIPALL